MAAFVPAGLSSTALPLGQGQLTPPELRDLHLAAQAYGMQSQAKTHKPERTKDKCRGFVLLRSWREAAARAS